MELKPPSPQLELSALALSCEGDGGAATSRHSADEQRLPDSPQLHELLDERQHARDLPDRPSLRDRCGVDAERGRLARERAGVLDDQCMRQGRATERLGELA